MRIGCHLSVAKGFEAAVKTAPTLGANAFQYFTKNPRGLRHTKPLNLKDAQAGRALLEELDVVAIGHAPYLINLAAPDDELYQLSIQSLAQDLEIGEAQGSYGVVVHCGKPKERGVQYGIERMQQAIDAVLKMSTARRIRLLVENTAGQGSEIGSSLEELLTIVAPFPVEQVGLCFDTQHAFAAGILSREAPQQFPGFERPEFMDRLSAIHLNDSKVPFGARKDRHELIGQGYLGLDAIRTLLNDARLSSIPFYLETPVDRESQYADEIRLCRSLLDSQ
jgi:deoxyribonuclease-4